MKLKLLQQKSWLLMLIPVMSMTTVGCDNQFDIKKAQKFGKTAENYEQAYKGIVEDIYDSCMRRARFTTPIQETKDIPYTREDFENQCADFARYENSLLVAHEVLASYTAAFRELSSDEIIEQLDGAGKLAKSLIALPIPELVEVTSAKVFPLQEIAGELANAIQRAREDQFRRRVLKESVVEINTVIQKYIATLAEITDDTYRDLLSREEAEMRLYYSSIIQQELDKTEEERVSNPVQVSVLLVDQQWQEDRKKANYPEKFAKIDSYLKTLKNMANLHQELYVSVQESK